MFWWMSKYSPSSFYSSYTCQTQVESFRRYFYQRSTCSLGLLLSTRSVLLQKLGMSLESQRQTLQLLDLQILFMNFKGHSLLRLSLMSLKYFLETRRSINAVVALLNFSSWSSGGLVIKCTPIRYPSSPTSNIFMAIFNIIRAACVPDLCIWSATTSGLRSWREQSWTTMSEIFFTTWNDIMPIWSVISNKKYPIMRRAWRCFAMVSLVECGSLSSKLPRRGSSSFALLRCYVTPAGLLCRYLRIACSFTSARLRFFQIGYAAYWAIICLCLGSLSCVAEHTVIFVLACWSSWTVETAPEWSLSCWPPSFKSLSSALSLFDTLLQYPVAG